MRAFAAARYSFAFALATVLGLATLDGCVDKIEHHFDCSSICSRYKDCFDSSYDADSCTSKCEDNANNDSSFADKADDCDDCIGDKSCAGATFSCGTQCAGIVP